MESRTRAPIVELRVVGDGAVDERGVGSIGAAAVEPYECVAPDTFDIAAELVIDETWMRIDTFSFGRTTERVQHQQQNAFARRRVEVTGPGFHD